MSEEWRPVLGYEGLYEVSSQGRIRSLNRSVQRGSGAMTIMGRVLSPQPNVRDGRLKVELCRDGSQASYKVHALVAAHFLGPNPLGLDVLHNDGNFNRNSVDNLRYGTKSDNMYDAVRHGTHPQARKTHCPQGHPYDEENTRVYRDMRYCRACQAERRAARKVAA